MSNRPLKLAFVIGSDAHLEIADELCRAARKVEPHCVTTGISRRRFKADSLELEQSAMCQVFSRVITPARVPVEFRMRRLAIRLLRRLAPNLHESLFRPNPARCYPDLFDGGRIQSFDFVFSLNDRTYPAIDFVRAFQAVKVPVALVQDTFRRKDTGGRSDKGLFNGQGGCDLVYAWGDASIAYYLSVGVSRERIIAAGSPRMDRYVRMARELPPVNTIRENEGLPTDRPVILLAANSVYSSSLERPLSLPGYFTAIGRAIDWCREIGAFAVLKPHRNSLKDYESWGIPRWINSFPNACYKPHIELGRAVRACDAVLAFNSAVVLEASLLGRPVGMLASDQYSHGVDYLRHGICRKVDSLPHLKNLLDVGPDQKQEEGLNIYFSVRQTSAATIVEDALARIYRRPKTVVSPIPSVSLS